jgi:AraC-like DNA-binding protein
MIADFQGSQNWQHLAKTAGFKPTKLAQTLGVSLRTLQRHFRLHYAVTVSEWLTSTRLEEAYTRIVAGERVKEVAFDLGFNQLSHFSREFKRFYGVPPSLLARNSANQKIQPFPKAAAPLGLPSPVFHTPV